MRVFVSSTFHDLRDHRRAVRAALDADSDLEFAGMEEFGSTGLPAMETCQQAVDRTDVSVVLLGYRYGSLVPESNLSYTELEYDHSQMLGHPVFVYVRENFDKGVEDSTEDDERKRLLTKFRATVESEVVIERRQFTTPNDLAARVIRDLHRWLDQEAAGRADLQEPQLTIRDVLAYAGKLELRRQTRFLSPRVVLVDLNAINLAQTPPSTSSGLAMKMAKIKFELQIDGIDTFHFTDLRIVEGRLESPLEQRLEQIRQVNPLLVCFARDAEDVQLLEEFRDAGVDRIVWYRDDDARPPEDFPLLNRYQYSRDSLRSCQVAILTRNPSKPTLARLRFGQGQVSSYHDIAELMWAFGRFGQLDSRSRPGFQRQLGLTDIQLDGRLVSAEQWKLVEEADMSWRTTEAGAEFASEMVESVGGDANQSEELIGHSWAICPKTGSEGQHGNPELVCGPEGPCVTTSSRAGQWRSHG